MTAMLTWLSPVAADNTVIILLGHGDGTFTQANGSPISVGSFPEAVRTGDFNSDGILDLAVANAKDNTVSILLGNGDGTFTQASGSPVSVGAFPFFVAVADFNGDGFADVAVSNESDSTVSILLGHGDGTFAEASGSPIPSFNYNPGQVVAADFNGDGVPDLAVANFTPLFPSTVGNVVVMLGKGDGTFTPASGSPITVGTFPLAMVAGDFNQDGKTDLAVDNYGDITQPQTQTLTLLLGNGDGTFTAAGTPTQLGDSPNDLVAADFNGDGTTDLAIPELADNSTTILLNEFTQTATASISNVTIAGTGTHYVDAVYEGNTFFATSTSLTVPLQGSTVPTTLTLTGTTEQMITMPVTFTAQLAAISVEPPSAIPTGTVTFFDQSVNATLGTAPMGANGQAVFTTTAIGPGHHIIIASYSGDPSYLASTANTVPVQIDELRILRVGNNNTNILPGTTVVYTIQVEPQVATTFLYNVNFAASGLPAGATATFDPATLGGRRQNPKHQDDGDHRKYCVEHTTGAPVPPRAACPGTSASPHWSTQRAQAVAEDSPIPGSRAAGRDKPDCGRRVERVLRCGALRRAESSLHHHGDRYRRNSTAHSDGAPCDLLNGVRGAVSEKVCIDL